MSDWFPKMQDYFASQWPGYLAGAASGVLVMLAAAVKRVVGDWYRRRQELDAGVAAACCRCLSLIEHVAYETIVVEDLIENGFPIAMESESPELPAMRQLMLDRWTTGEMFYGAASRYLGYWVNRLNCYRDGGVNYSNAPRPGPEELRRAVLTSIPPRLRALVGKGLSDKHNRVERDMRLRPLVHLAARVSDIWDETAHGMDDTRLFLKRPKQSSEQ